MNTVRQTGAPTTPYGSVQEAGAIAPIGQAPKAPATPATPAAPISLDPQDQVSQTSGASGKAAPVDLMPASGPQSEQIRSLLAKKDFDGLTALVTNLGSRGLGTLDLSLDEIKTIAAGMGQGSTFSIFTKQEQLAVQALLTASKLNINQKVEGLQSLLGNEAVISFVRGKSPEGLSKLSQTNRQNLMNMLVPDSGAIGSVMGAVTEVGRRVTGDNAPKVEEKSAAQLLRSTHNETEMRALLAGMNQFSRDDVVYSYVNSLTAEELKGLSDGMKKDLMANLLDTGISFAGLNIDLNSLGNIDEFLNMTFDKHADAAKTLYLALRPETRKSTEVQQLVAKSDLMMQQIKNLETSLNQDIQAGKMTQAKIDDYRSQLQNLQNSDSPEVKQKADQLLATLSKLQTGLNQAGQTQKLATGALNTAHTQLEKTKASLASTQATVQKLSGDLKASDARIGQAESKLQAQLQQLSQMREGAGQLGEDFKGLLDQVEPLLEGAKSGGLRGQMPKVDALLSKLKQADAKLQGLSAEQTEIRQQLSSLSAKLGSQRQELAQAMSGFNAERATLAQNTDKLKGLLRTYTGQVGQLEKDFTAARQGLEALDQSQLPEADRAKIQQDLDAARTDIDHHQANCEQIQTALDQTLVPEALKLDAAQASLAPLAQAVETGVERASAQVESLQETVNVAAEATVQVQSALDIVKAQASNLRQQLGAQVPDMTAKQLQAAKKQIEAMVQNLRKEDPSGEQVRQELQGLGELSAQIAEIQGAIGNSQKIQKELGLSLKAAKQDGSSMSSELQHAKAAVDQANAEVSQAQTSIQQTEQKLKDMTASLTDYQQKLSDWSTQLAQLDAANSSSKADFMKAITPLKDSDKAGQAASSTELQQQIDVNAKKLEADFSSIDDKRAMIQAQIKALKKQISGIEKNMGDQRTQLESYKTTLQTKTATMQKSQAQIASLTEKLNLANVANRNVLKEAEDKLEQLSQQPKNAAVVRALAAARKNVTDLKAQIATAEGLIASSRQQVDSLTVINRQSTAMQANLDTSIGDIKDLTQGQLQKATAALGEVDARFQALDAEKAQIQHQAEELMKKIAGGGISLEQVKTELEALFGKVKDRQSLGELQGVGKTLMDAWRTLETGRGLLTANGKLNAEAAGLTDQARQEVAAMQALLGQLGGEADQMESEVKDSQQALLADQNALLEARRQIGIVNPDYQQALARSAQLLQSGRPMTKEEVQELQGLEQKMSTIESALAKTSQHLSERITSLNIQKSKINARIDTLNTKIAQLDQLRGRMTEMRGKLTASRGQMQSHRDELVARRAEVQKALMNLKNMPNIQGLAEYKQMVAQFESTLKDLDTQIGEFDKSIQTTDNSIKGLDSGLEQVNTSLNAAQNMKARLEMIKGKVMEQIRAHEKAKQEVDNLRGIVGQMHEEIKTVIEKATELEASESSEAGGPLAPQPGDTKASESGATDQPQNPLRAEQQKQSFANRLSNQLTSLWSSNQRQSDAKREAAHQARRDALSKEIAERLKQAAQHEAELKANHAHDQHLAEISAHLVEQALSGQNQSSGLNIV